MTGASAYAAAPTSQPGASAQGGEEMVISASRIETPASQVGSSISVVDSKQIDRKQQPLVADVLRTVPGVDVVRSGGPGQQTSLFIRGASSNHTLVLIDGIPANDPSSPGGTFDFSTLTVDNVERIEVLRGPQSLFWGSSAMGGVVNIISKRGQQGPPRFFYQQEYGSFQTWRESAGVSGGTKAFNYSLSLSQTDSEGISAANSELGNTEKDGFSLTSGAGRVGVNVTENFDIDLIFRGQNSAVNIDQGGGPPGMFTGDQLGRKLYTNEEFARVQPRVLWFGGALEQVYGVSINHIRRHDNDPSFGQVNTGQIVKLDLQNNLHLGETNTASAGIDYTDESFETEPRGAFSSSTPDMHQQDLGFYVQDMQRFFDRLTVTAGIRHDDTSSGGDANTYRLTGAYELKETDTLLRGSIGTGFKAPTLFQRFSSYGNPALKPEESEGWDVGVEQAILPETLSVGATYFHNRFKDLIDFDFATSKYGNVGAAQTQGVETFVAVRPIREINLRASYTYTDATDLSTDQPLVRRPHNKVGIDATWEFLKNANVTLSAVYFGERQDYDPVTFSRTTLGGYTLVNLAAEYRFTPNLKVFGRIENLLDEDYEEVAGFGTPGLSGYVGLRLDI